MCHAFLFSPVALTVYIQNLSFEDDGRIAGWARALAEEAQGAPLMIQISEDLPPEQTGRAALALARALNGKEA